jgi:hypothetical protein
LKVVLGGALGVLSYVHERPLVLPFFSSPSGSTDITSWSANSFARVWPFPKTITHSGPFPIHRPCRQPPIVLSPDIIGKQLNHWAIQQVEYCQNFIFKRHFPIHQLYERSCDIGRMRLTADKVSRVFGFRLHKRLRGKLQTVLEKIDHRHHVLHAGARNAVLRMYEQFSTFLRVEALRNNLKDFGLKNFSTLSTPCARS